MVPRPARLVTSTRPRPPSTSASPAVRRSAENPPNCSASTAPSQSRWTQCPHRCARWWPQEWPRTPSTGRPMRITFVTELQTVASGAYGKDWDKRGRSHLGEAALLLTALWPSGGPPAVQGTTVHRISLRHIAPVKAAIAAGAAMHSRRRPARRSPRSQSHRPRLPSQQAAAVHPVTLQPVTSTPQSVSVSPASHPVPASPSPSPSTPQSISASLSPSTPQSISASPSPSTPHPVSAPQSLPTATVCQPDGTGCTKAGKYHDPNALLSSNYTGFEVTWTSTSVQPYSSGVPLYWTAGMTYKNVESSTLTLGCPGNWANASSVREYMSGGKGNDGMVAADSTTCSENPSWTASVAPGGIAEVTSPSTTCPGQALR